MQDNPEKKPDTWRDFAVSCLVALLVLVGVDAVFRDSQFSRACDNGAWIPSKREAFKKSNADIVVAGSSVIAEGLNPGLLSDRIFERTGKRLKVFNFGVSAGNWAADYLDADTILEMPPEHRPKYYVVSMSAMEFSSASANTCPSYVAWSGALRFADLLPVLRAAPTFDEAANDLMLTSFRLLAIRPDALALFFDQKAAPPAATWPADGGGGEHGAVDPGTQNDRAVHRAESYRAFMYKPCFIDRKTPRAYFSALVSRLRRGGVQVAFVGNPQAPQMDVINDSDSLYPEYTVYVNELARSLGVTFTNFHSLPELTAADFVDGDHMNKNGSTKYVRKLADDVLVPMILKGN